MTEEYKNVKDLYWDDQDRLHIITEDGKHMAYSGVVFSDWKIPGETTREDGSTFFEHVPVRSITTRKSEIKRAQ